MARLKKAARDNMTAPNLMAAGAVALGAAAFAYLRNEQRRTRLKDTAQRWRDSITSMGSRSEAAQPTAVFP